jgi:transposase-like protein
MMRAPEWRTRRVAELYRGGYRYWEIARLVGVSAITVYRDLGRTGTSRYPRHRRSQAWLTPRNREIVDAYAAPGATYEDVARAFDVTPEAIGYHVRRARRLAE